MRRQRSAKIVATLGPASSSPEMIDTLFRAGVDVFRLNFSHGKPEEHRARYDAIRAIEKKQGRPIGVMADMQGPKLRVGTFADGKVKLETGKRFRLDLGKSPGDARRAPLPHPEIFAAIEPGVELLLDDGNIRLKVEIVRQGFRRDGGHDRRRPVRPQGRQRAERGAAALGAHAQGPRRSRLRARARRRLDRALVRAAARRRGRGAQADRRPRRRSGEAREAGGDPAAPRDPRARRFGDGGARRSRRRDAARGRAAGAAPDHSRLPALGKAGGGRDADARIDGARAGADPRGGLGRGDRGL